MIDAIDIMTTQVITEAEYILCCADLEHATDPVEIFTLADLMSKFENALVKLSELLCEYEKSTYGWRRE